jgi:hypothetical protein
VAFSYEGMEVIVKREKFRLGPQVLFVSREPSVAEWRQHLKVLYVDGGLFASKPTYAVFLDSLRDSDSAAWIEALSSERSAFGSATKDDLRRILEPEPVKSLDQLSFKW